GRAGLGAGVPAVGFVEDGAVPAGLVGELAVELGQGGVGEPAGETPVGEHAGHVEVLDGDLGEVGGGPVGELVEGVAAQVGDPGVETAEALGGVAAAGQAWLGSRQAPIGAPQVPQAPFGCVPP